MSTPKIKINIGFDTGNGHQSAIEIAIPLTEGMEVKVDEGAIQQITEVSTVASPAVALEPANGKAK